VTELPETLTLAYLFKGEGRSRPCPHVGGKLEEFAPPRSKQTREDLVLRSAGLLEA